jgi:hypothetical protein
MSHVPLNIEDDDASSEVASDSSSLVYDREPFKAFRTRVLAFALELWDDAVPGDIVVNRMNSREFNRVTGISRRIAGQRKSVEYIFRIRDLTQHEQTKMSLLCATCIS